MNYIDGLLNKIKGQLYAEDKLTAESAYLIIKNTLKGTDDITKDKEIVAYLMWAVCGAFGIRSEQLFGQSRKREIVIARHTYTSLLNTFTTLSQDEISAIMGYCNHTMVIYSVIKIINVIESGWNPESFIILGVYKKVRAKVIEIGHVKGLWPEWFEPDNPKSEMLGIMSIGPLRRRTRAGKSRVASWELLYTKYGGKK